MGKKRKSRRVSKRRYVQAERVELIRDDKSGVMVLAQGGDLGANYKARVTAGHIVIRDREISPGGTVISRGAQVVIPGRIEAIILSGALDKLHADKQEARKMANAAAEWMRGVMERRRLRGRVVALYQPTSDRGPVEVSKAQEQAAKDLSKAGAAIGWACLSALMDAILFEDKLSQKQENLVIDGIERLVVWLKV